MIVGYDEDVNLDVDLTPESRISGTVTIPGATSPFDGFVRLFDGEGVQVTEDWVGSESDGGTYEFPGLRAGTYYVQFADFFTGAGVPEWYADAANLGSATPIVLGVSRSTVADAELGSGPTISGRVTDAVTGDPIPNAFVWLLSARGGEIYYSSVMTRTDVDGYYSIGTAGLTSFDYTLYFGDENAGSDYCDGPYVCEYLGGGHSGDTATWFPIVSGDSMSGLDAALDLGGTITGNITGTGDPGRHRERHRPRMVGR